MIFCRSVFYFLIFTGFVVASTLEVNAEPVITSSTITAAKRSNINAVATTDGLVAFWDFAYQQEGYWASYFDAELVDRSFLAKLKRIGDAKSYTVQEWSYADEDSVLKVNGGGPFGMAVRFNQGHIYASVEREDFDGTLLDLSSKTPFTMIAWCKFIARGKRHMVAGIWDEGGWDKYAGRRQVALFAGLFKQQGVIAHVSATGAASYPQSKVKGAQFARLRAIDGKAFESEQWVAMATSYDPKQGVLKAYLNGVMTPLKFTDFVAQDVYAYTDEQAANPFSFSLPIYSPRSVVLKYNGYLSGQSAICEHRLHVDVKKGLVTYFQEQRSGLIAKNKQEFRMLFNVKREGRGILPEPLIVKGVSGQSVALPTDLVMTVGDEIWTSLEVAKNEKWVQLGSVLKRKLLKGAPFTFGRALGLGSEDLHHGSQIYIDGVAVFNRVLSGEELKELSFGLGE